MTFEVMQASRSGARADRSRGGLRLPTVLIVLVAALTLTFAAAAQAASPGQLRIAGYNSTGQLGNGSLEEPASPFLVPGLSRTVTSVAGGYYDTYAVLANGQLEGWGYNKYGELGDGTNTERRSPVTIPLPASATDVAAGYYFAMALLSNGTVATWGYGDYGELGNGKAEELRSASVVPGVEHATSIAAGCYFGMALRSDGRVEAWGYGGYGDLGDGKAEEHESPIVIPGLENVVSIAANCYDAYAVLADGEVRAWGYNEYGELGDGTTKQRDAPIVVPGLSGVKEVAAGVDFAIALHTDGSLSGWGYNRYSELGDGTKSERLTPESLTSWPAGVSSIATAAYDSYAILANGEPFGAGYNYYDELGDGSKAERESPEDLDAFLPGVVAFGHSDYNYDLLAIQGAFANLSTATLAFSNQPAGTSSPPQSVVLTNKGPAPLTVSGDVLTGTGAASFTKSSDGCQGVTLATGETCTVAVAFTPTAPGTDVATLAVSSSAANALTGVSLTGTAPAPPPPPPPSPSAPVLSGLSLSHSLFRAASSGPTAVAALARGTVVSYTDSVAGTTTVTIQLASVGVLKSVNGSKSCVAMPKHPKSGSKPCTLYKTLGTFSHVDAAGPNRLKFSGRLHNHKLPAGSYRLVAVAKLGSLSSKTQTKSFKIHS
jgi:alpha-tubulin suppressor-like RCC1 family protein